ncbi:GNAT family N-acetyltransferase [Tamlana fucoidanivorans]|uniref:GNAT family N-acetyltransferase n=1 Tax=Allotamlana fucoidanivorans TaxID=2583814 RepID=A0A5C4SQA3_9FLAO|nr:GNAT family N-acetyltransferase [Tamlana fucoidanivorans]TNJ46476.1 GNAT family N-acetyltransferase [Tamlana fucoidanivorans]
MRKDFYNTFYIKGQIPDVYNTIGYTYKAGLFYQRPIQKSAKTDGTYIINLFPSYLEEKNLKKISISQANLNGYAVVLPSSNLEDFLKHHFKSNARTSILKRKKRLEICFPIKYKMYFGSISYKTYETIMRSLKTMLLKRFTQKKTANEFFAKWNQYLNRTYELIINKEASLFVIYNNESMIGISLNYHSNEVCIGHLIAYDIDYAKFGIGNTIVLKLVEWCIENKYTLLDMGNGDLDYKFMWCNYKYYYQYHLILSNGALTNKLLISFELLKIKFKNTLKHFNIDVLLTNCKNFIEIRKRVKPFNNLNIIVEPMTKPINLEDAQLLNFYEINTPELKKACIDFMYLQQNHISNIQIFKLHRHLFYIKSGEHIQKIRLEENIKKAINP